MTLGFNNLGRLRATLKGNRPVVWRTFFVPPEIIAATGAAALAPERVVSALAMHPERHHLQDYIDSAEAAGHDRKECSFVKGVYGLAHADFVRPPTALITSSSYCNAMPALMRQLAREMKWPHSHLNIPQDATSDSDVAYTVEQIKTIAHHLCKITGTDVSKYENEYLPRALELSNATAGEWTEIQDLRRIRPDILPQPAAIDLALNLSDDWGTESFLRSLRLLKRDLETKMETESASASSFVRLYWFHLRPYFPNAVFDLVREHNAVICSELVNTIPWEKLDTNAPYSALARKAIQCAEIAAYGNRYQRFVKEVVKRDQIDGIIYFFSENCQWAEETFPAIREDFCRAGDTASVVPVLALHADGLVSSAKNVMTTRLSAFLQGLQQVKGLHPGKMIDRSATRTPQPTRINNFFIGLDAGSNFVKAVIVNECEEVLAFDKKRVVADVHDAITLCLEKVLSVIGRTLEERSFFIATGVSQENVEGADEKLSEILCHSAAIKKLLPNVTAFIEVGGQDVKGVNLSTGSSELNDRCAAGIGTFLDEFAAMLKIRHRARLLLYNTADEGTAFPTLCKAIIQTEVRHAVARREPLQSIVRGFYDALARIVANSVHAMIPPGAQLVGLCGGGAMDSAFVNAMRKALGSDRQLLVPEKPIYTGALGAALVALQYAKKRTNGKCSSDGRDVKASGLANATCV